MTLPMILMYVLMGLKWLIIIDVLLSWIVPPDKFPRTVTSQITDPLYAPIRAVLRPDKTAGMDFSPLLVLLIIHFMENMLAKAF